MNIFKAETLWRFAVIYIHSYLFIENRNDRMHLHKYTQYKKNMKTVKQLITVLEQHAVNKIPSAQLTRNDV